MSEDGLLSRASVFEYSPEVKKHIQSLDSFDISIDAIRYLSDYPEFFARIVEYEQFLSFVEYPKKIRLYRDPEDGEKLIIFTITLPKWTMELEDEIADKFIEQFPDEKFKDFLLSFR